MHKIAKGVWQLSGFPRDLFNIYLAEDVLIDAGTRWARGRILSQVRGRPVRMVALTHCHPDHQGCAKAICEKFDIPLACHEADLLMVEGRAPMQPYNRILKLGLRVWAGPPYPVARVLHDGDEVAGFRVIHAPGHTAGHVMFFRESDRVLIAGDVLANIHFITGKPGLRQPPAAFCVDAAENRRSIQKLIDLDPKVVCFGHGPPLREVEQLQRFAQPAVNRPDSRSTADNRPGTERWSACDRPDPSLPGPKRLSTGQAAS
ncbi:MAG TPA: MBL fold metallo-hydrolase [Gemmataceae bacterium]|jgi:hydroxyacylglutathione hydrolase|nr:MBL fold metallo-hydrolase [Gemmataceae bacterium]